MKAIKTENLVTGYKEMEIVHGISIELNEGEITTIIGPNGAGKSTLLKALFGLLPAFTGKIFLKGNDITGMKPFNLVKKGLSFVPQSNNTFASLTVLENLQMGAFTRADDIKETIKEMYKLFPVLKEKANLLAGNLSGGEQQMVAFARALMSKPSILLLDEPSAGLSPKLSQELFAKIQAIRERGISILMVEQNVKIALKNSDRAYIFVAGKKKHEGKAKELLNEEDLKKHYFGE